MVRESCEEDVEINNGECLVDEISDIAEDLQCGKKSNN